MYEHEAAELIAVETGVDGIGGVFDKVGEIAAPLGHGSVESGEVGLWEPRGWTGVGGVDVSEMLVGCLVVLGKGAHLMMRLPRVTMRM